MAVYDSNTPEKEDQSFKSIIIVMVLLVVFFCGGYFLGTFLTPKEKEVKEEKPEIMETQYDTDDEKIVSLISRLVAGTDCWNIEIYTNDHPVTVKDIPSERIYQVVELASFYSKGIETVRIEDFDAEIQKYFGKGYLFEPEKIDFNGSNCFQYTYDKETKIFTKRETACGGTCGPNRTQYKITRAVEKEQVLKIYVKVLFGSKAESTNFYSDYARTNFVTNDYEHIEEYIHKGEDYIFTFEKVDNHYVYVSSEEM